MFLTKLRNRNLASAQWSQPRRFHHWRPLFGDNGYPPFKSATQDQNFSPELIFISCQPRLKKMYLYYDWVSMAMMTCRKQNLQKLKFWNNNTFSLTLHIFQHISCSDFKLFGQFWVKTNKHGFVLCGCGCLSNLWLMYLGIWQKTVWTVDYFLS